MRDLIFEHHPYPCRITLCLDAKAWRRVTKRLGVVEPFPGETQHGNVTSFTKASAMLEIVVSFDPRIIRTRTHDEVVALVAHECVYVMQRVEEKVGGRGEIGDEGQAYLVQSLVLWVLAELPKLKRRAA